MLVNWAFKGFLGLSWRWTSSGTHFKNAIYACRFRWCRIAK
jgi:hypothetical protein